MVGAEVTIQMSKAPQTAWARWRRGLGGAVGRHLPPGQGTLSTDRSERAGRAGGGCEILTAMPYNAELGPTTYVPPADRYESMPYRRCGRRGLKLPAISLGLWQNFGDDRPLATSRAILRRAFDLGITHFDLANNYGPPYGSAELNFGRVFEEDLSAYRDELVISTKAGWDMWPGPYGEYGSRKYLLASLDQSLRRMRLDHVDIFYSHRFDPDTPLEETMGALADAVRAGKALHVGISSYGPERTEEAATLLASQGVPLLIHQPSYSLFNRWIEDELLNVTEREGVGVIAFTALAQGLLTDKYLNGVPEDSRMRRGIAFDQDWLSDDVLARVRALNEIAGRRGQTLAQMALAWVLRDPRVTSTLVGASSVQQLEQNVAALDKPSFDEAELADIDRYAVESGIDLWRGSSSG
jgi:L-glyceraldehyde 3-phosphate reductase